MKKYALIVAGGKGLRMNSDIPKQFLLINNTPVLMRTISRFHSYDPSIRILVVLPKDQIEYWRQLCQKHEFKIEHLVIEGGAQRFNSVAKGLEHVEKDSIVAIHDGVRPFVDDSVIRDAFHTAQIKGSAIPAICLTDSARKIHSDGTSESANRSEYRLVQTPQTFRSELIKEAFNKALASDQSIQSSFTDDAFVYEFFGGEVSLIDGNRENIKITSPEDLDIASVFAKKYN